MKSIEKIAELLTISQRTLGIVESCTGGLLCHHITNMPGSSNFFDGGIVAYGNASKIEVVGVTEECLRKNGAVSERTALAMADGARENFTSDIGIGITGIAGPSGGSEEKPVGLVHIAISDMDRSASEAFRFQGNREKIKNQAVEKAIEMCIRFLEEE